MDLNKELIIAAEEGNEKIVMEMLSKGASPDAMGPNSSALHCAAFNGHRNIVKLLLEKGANPNVSDNQSFFPLHLATSKKELEIVKDLLAHGADINVTTDKLGTVLHLAAAIDFYDILDLKEIKKMNIEARDYEQKTVLNVAASCGSYTMGWRLLQLGADVHTQDQLGYTPMLNTLRSLNVDKVETWSMEGSNEGVNAKYQIKNGCFRYIKPYKGGDNEMGRVLSLMDQYSICGYSWGPKEHFPYVKSLLLMGYFLKNGANFDFQGDNGNKAMALACSVGEPEAINLLAKKGISFDIKNDNGVFPLHYLARSKRLDGLKAYYKWNENSDSNVLDSNGWTPGHYFADMGGHADIAKLLIKNGLDLSIKSTAVFGPFPIGTTAREVAEHWNDDTAVALLTPKKKKVK